MSCTCHWPPGGGGGGRTGVRHVDWSDWTGQSHHEGHVLQLSPLPCPYAPLTFTEPGGIRLPSQLKLLGNQSIHSNINPLVM